MDPIENGYFYSHKSSKKHEILYRCLSDPECCLMKSYASMKNERDPANEIPGETFLKM